MGLIKQWAMDVSYEIGSRGSITSRVINECKRRMKKQNTIIKKKIKEINGDDFLKGVLVAPEEETLQEMAERICLKK